MGQNVFCDLCHKTLPNAEALSALKFDDDEIAGLCLTCSSAIKTGIQKKLAEAQAAFTAAIQAPEAPEAPAALAPPAPPAPPEVPPAAPPKQPAPPV